METKREKWIRYGVAIFILLILLFGSVAIIFNYTAINITSLQQIFH